MCGKNITAKNSGHALRRVGHACHKWLRTFIRRPHVEQVEAMPQAEKERLCNCQVKEAIGPTANDLDAGALADAETIEGLWDDGFRCEENPPGIPEVFPIGPETERRSS